MGAGLSYLWHGDSRYCNRSEGSRFFISGVEIAFGMSPGKKSTLRLLFPYFNSPLYFQMAPMGGKGALRSGTPRLSYCTSKVGERQRGERLVQGEPR